VRIVSQSGRPYKAGATVCCLRGTFDQRPFWRLVCTERPRRRAGHDDGPRGTNAGRLAWASVRECRPTCTDVALIGTLEQDATTNEPGVTMRLFAVALLMPVAFLIGRATNPTAERRRAGARSGDSLHRQRRGWRQESLLPPLARGPIPGRLLHRQHRRLEKRQPRQARLLSPLATLTTRVGRRPPPRAGLRTA
jgi:hypothetical protein